MGKSSQTLHILLFLILCGAAGSRPLLHHQVARDCKERYGFMPCSTTAQGNVFLIVMYGYFIFMAAQCRSKGSERLANILGRRSVSARLFLPVFVALPDSMLILVSGLSGSRATAQSQVSVGMGLLSGSTVNLLTIIWGCCILVGIQKGNVKKDTEGDSLTGSGVTTDIWTCYTARIMALSIVPFIIVQLPHVLHPSSGRDLKVLVSPIVSAMLFVSYCLYQVLQPLIQRKRIAHATFKHVMSGVLLHLKRRALGRLLTDDGKPNRTLLEKLFNAIDVNGDGHLSASELRSVFIGIRFDDDFSFDIDEVVRELMKNFGTRRYHVVGREEFVKGISKWLNIAKQYDDVSMDPDRRTMKCLIKFHKKTRQERDLLGEQNDNEVSLGGTYIGRTSLNAILRLVIGTIAAATFADPLVDAVDHFSNATSIPSFFISFIVLPWATSSGEAVSAIIFARHKNLTATSSKTLSELYDTVTINSVLCQSVFFALVYARGLTWDFSSEVLAMMMVCFVMGSLASFRTTYRAWTSALAFLLYALSLTLFMLLNVFSVHL